MTTEDADGDWIAMVPVTLNGADEPISVGQLQPQHSAASRSARRTASVHIGQLRRPRWPTSGVTSPPGASSTVDPISSIRASVWVMMSNSFIRRPAPRCG